MIAEDLVSRGAAASQIDSLVTIVIDDVPITGAGAADRSASPLHIDAVVAVAWRRCSTSIGANPVAGDRDAVGSGLYLDTVCGEAIDL